MKQKTMPYHPELAFEYLSLTYDYLEARYGRIYLGPDVLASIFGLRVESQQDGLPSRCTFRGEVISEEQAKLLLHTHLDGLLCFSVRNGFRKIGIGKRKKRFISDEAAKYIIDKLHNELLAADLPRFPTRMVADRWGAQSFWALPKLPSPTELEKTWPKLWTLTTVPANLREINEVSCAALDVSAYFSFSHWSPASHHVGTLRWWILATAIRSFKRKPGQSQMLAKKLAEHAVELNLSEELRVDLVMEAL